MPQSDAMYYGLSEEARAANLWLKKPPHVIVLETIDEEDPRVCSAYLQKALESSFPTPACIVQYAPQSIEASCARLTAKNKERFPDVALFHIILDVDVRQDPTTWPSAEGGLAELHAVQDKLVAAGFPKPWGYTTRKGVRVGWRLDQPVPLDVASDFIHRVHEIIRTRTTDGVVPDPNTRDWARVFFVPRMDDRVERNTRKLKGDTREHAQVDIEPLDQAILSVETIVGDRPLQAQKATKASVSLGNMPPRPEMEDVDQDTWDLLKVKLGQVGQHLENAEAFAKVGERDLRLFQVTRDVAKALNARDAEGAKRVFLAVALSAVANGDLDGSDAEGELDKAWEKSWRAVENAASEKIEEEALTAAMEAREEPVAVVLPGGGRYSVWDPNLRDFTMGYGASDYPYVLERTGMDMSRFRTKKGYMTAVEINRILAVPLATSEATRFGTLQQPYGGHYDRERRELLRTSAHFRLVAEEAVFDPDVDEWLRAFAGAGGPAMAERFLDWLATFPDVEHPTAALYLCGKRATGKSLLISALATLWGDGAPVSFDEASGTRGFNKGVANNPVISADEAAGTSMTESKAQSEAFIRQVLTARVHELSRKNQDTAKLWGCVRLIAAVNNLARLPFSGGDRNSDENDALAERILFLAPPEKAAEVLKNKDLHDWVWKDVPGGRPGKIAKHVLWLHLHRTVQVPGRLLVEGAGLLVELRQSSQGYERLMERIGLTLAKKSPPDGFYCPKADPMFLYFTSEDLWNSWPTTERKPSYGVWRSWIHDLTFEGTTAGWGPGGLRKRYRKISLELVKKALAEATTYNSCAALDSLAAAVVPDAEKTVKGLAQAAK